MPHNQPSHIFRKSHYIWLASFLRDEKRITKQNPDPSALIQFYQIVTRLTQDLSNENPNFDTELFLINSDCENLLTPELNENPILPVSSIAPLSR